MCGCENKSSTCIQLPSDISPYFSVDKYFSELNTEEKRNTARINLGLNNEVGIDTAYLDAGSMNILDMISEILKVMEKVGKRFIPVVYYDDSDALIGEITDGHLDTFIGSALKLGNNITLNLDNIKGKAEIVFTKENNIWKIYSRSFVETVNPNDITLLKSSVSNINSKIPSQASASNLLADKEFVNSSITTNTADFKGTFNSLEDLNQVTADANDYAFVVGVDTAGNTKYDRYKRSNNSWNYEYTLNNSSFTAELWNTLNSGFTNQDKIKLDNLPSSLDIATKNSNGLMSSTDKVILDNLQSSYETSYIELILLILILPHDIKTFYFSNIDSDSKIVLYVSNISGTDVGDDIEVKTEYNISTYTSEGYDAELGENIIWNARWFPEEVSLCSGSISVYITGNYEEDEMGGYVGKTITGYILKVRSPKTASDYSGLMNLQEKLKLNNVPSDLTTILNGKASTAVATTSSNGLMSSGDKTKLDSINPNNITTLQTDLETVERVSAYALNDLNTRVKKFEPYEVQVVDLDLPSGTLWADRNIGAENITDEGLYFTWGSPEGFTKDSGRYCGGTRNSERNWSGPYSREHGSELGDIDNIPTSEYFDAARKNLGSPWKMPTQALFEELCDTEYVTNTWVTNYQGSGVDGRLFTSVSNGNTLFFPNIGSFSGNYSSDLGRYWSSENYSNDSAFYFYIGSSIVNPQYSTKIYRYNGMSVRAIK